MSLADGISFYAASSGTGAFVYGSPRASFLNLSQAVASAAITDGQTVSYLAQDSLTNPTQREWGHGTYSQAGNSISRTNPLGSIDAGQAGTTSPVNFHIAPVVSLTALAEDIVILPSGTVLSAITAAGAAPQQTDTVIGVSAGSTDVQYTVAQVATSVVQGGIPSSTFAALPSSPATGWIAVVTNGTTGLINGNTLTGSGGAGAPYLVWYNGTHWTVMST